jgi:hypothetical protein
MERKLVDNLYISNESAEILDYMVDHKLMPKSFDKGVVTTYIEDEDFNLILFLKREDKNEFLRFRFADFSRHPDSFLYLNHVFEELKCNDPEVYTSAKSKLEEMFHMIPVFRAFYYGTNDELKEETYI